MRYVMFVFVTLLLHANLSMSQNAPPIGLPEGDPAAVACPAGQYLAGFNVWSEPQISGFSPYCVAMQSDGRWQGSPQIHLESMLSGALQDSVRVDTSVATGAYASTRDGEIIQLGLTCSPTKPALAVSRFQSAKESNSMASSCST
jgi:hypothetical protein